MSGIQFRIPKIAALETGEDGHLSRIEYVCGCVTIRKGVVNPFVPFAPLQWTWPERCPIHFTQTEYTGGTKDATLPWWWGR